MGKCVACGKHGLFLSVNADGMCKSCAESARIQKQIEAEKKRSEEKKAKIMPPYLDYGFERLFITRIYNCDIRDYTGENIDEYDEVTFITNHKAYDDFEYGYSAKVACNGKVIGYVDRQGINDLIHEETVRAYIVNPEFAIPSFNIAAYSKITSLPAISVIRLQTSEENVDNYNQMKDSIRKFAPVTIDGNHVFLQGREIGLIPEKEMLKFDEIPADREQYPVFFSERVDKKGRAILSIKVYYSIAKDKLFRDTSQYARQ